MYMTCIGVTIPRSARLFASLFNCSIRACCAPVHSRVLFRFSIQAKNNSSLTSSGYVPSIRMGTEVTLHGELKVRTSARAVLFTLGAVQEHATACLTRVWLKARCSDLFTMLCRSLYIVAKTFPTRRQWVWYVRSLYLESSSQLFKVVRVRSSLALTLTLQ
jgi:hypothetical protein